MVDQHAAHERVRLEASLHGEWCIQLLLVYMYTYVSLLQYKTYSVTACVHVHVRATASVQNIFSYCLCIHVHMCVGLYEECESGRRVKRSLVQPSLVLTLSPSQINMTQCYKKHLDLAGIDRGGCKWYKLFCPCSIEYTCLLYNKI